MWEVTINTKLRTNLSVIIIGSLPVLAFHKFNL